MYWYSDISYCVWPTRSLIDWLGFNAVFNNFSVISRRPVHLPMHFLVFSHQYSTQHLPKQLAAFPYRLSPLVEDEWRMSHWLLSIVGKKVGRAGIRTHNPWIDSPRRYRLSYRGSARLAQEQPSTTLIVKNLEICVHLSNVMFWNVEPNLKY